MRHLNFASLWVQKVIGYCAQETTLADLLQLNLYCFEEEVRGIVDKAVKEMAMEKVLSELNSTWTGLALTCAVGLLASSPKYFFDSHTPPPNPFAGMQFQYEPHNRTQIPLLSSDEELIETLEDNQVQLQNLISSKYIAHFLDEVSSWQTKLSVADSVISIWFEVQRNWTHLESIFIGSEDIRSQLPEVTKRFPLDFSLLIQQRVSIYHRGFCLRHLNRDKVIIVAFNQESINRRTVPRLLDFEWLP